MMNEISKRIFTSFLLVIILFFSIKNILILLLVLFVILFLLINEFNFIYSKIFNKKKVFHFILIFLTLLYLSYFILSIFFYLNSDINNKEVIFLFIISISISTDIGGYVFGKTFKGKKLTKISPNKTYSGMIGSFVLSILVAFLIFKNINLTLNYLLITIIISCISQVGDLLISFLKRKAKIKNTGLILPGHGGLLDRLDGIIFALPLGLILTNM
tara:strand:+ start:467 stop:1111 length:645 start_codon:yes stop_codon:yes gene_type:complete